MCGGADAAAHAEGRELDNLSKMFLRLSRQANLMAVEL